ncbi:MAG: hypothetical protein CMI00_13185 [Oceanospirillaceae bacterium]|nr:hypothetical protein [Oceanospirillaceae bacterium]|tara:strand:+ start:827 stop:1126 length:300 start_codon:yes stop_codon:yes gene_type:complete
MSDLFEQVKNLSLELRSLIRQGVKDGVDDRIQMRNTLLQQWFGEISDLIQLTNEQQQFLEDLLTEEQQLLSELQAEQRKLSGHEQGKKKLNSYQQVSRH